MHEPADPSLFGTTHTYLSMDSSFDRTVPWITQVWSLSSRTHTRKYIWSFWLTTSISGFSLSDRSTYRGRPDMREWRWPMPAHPEYLSFCHEPGRSFLPYIYIKQTATQLGPSYICQTWWCMNHPSIDGAHRHPLTAFRHRSSTYRMFRMTQIDRSIDRSIVTSLLCTYQLLVLSANNWHACTY